MRVNVHIFEVKVSNCAHFLILRVIYAHCTYPFTTILASNHTHTSTTTTNNSEIRSQHDATSVRYLHGGAALCQVHLGRRAAAGADEVRFLPKMCSSFSRLLIYPSCSIETNLI